MSRSERFLYTIEQASTLSPPEVLTEALDRHVNRFLIEFLNQGGVKPHATVNLNFAKPFKRAGNARICYGCRLSMDYAGVGPAKAGGEFFIKI